MKRTLIAFLALLLCLSFFLACGQKSEETKETAAPSSEPAVTSGPAPVAPASESEGILVAKEILSVFDQAVTEAAELAKPQPEASELKPKIQEIFDKFKPKMEEINVRYLALKDKDIRLFGEANGYLGENRGRHVYQKDVTLGDALAYYNFEKGDTEFVNFLSSKLVELIEVAIKR